MLWQDRRESENVEDRRGMGGKTMVGGIGTLIFMLVVYLLGGNPLQVLQQVQQSAPPTAQQAPADDNTTRFVRTILADTEDFWGRTFSRLGSRYSDPTLVLFNGTTQSGCGFANAATGPFYCPSDSRVYLDESFFEELQNRFHAGGDFASAYVIAHEVGHHVQHLLGITDQVDAQRAHLGKSAQNQLSVRLELQADFLAGMWARYEAQQAAANGKGTVVQPGDIEQALAAASAIGDDRLQKQGQGYVVPDAFTHGTSAQRVRWFKKGFESDDIRKGDTFNSDNL